MTRAASELAYVGVDLGASSIGVVVGDGEGAVLGRNDRRTPTGRGGEAVESAVLAAVEAACRDAGIEPERVAAAGVGAIGPLVPAEGTVVDPANLPSVDRIEVVEPLAALLSADVRLHNDATAAAIGERFVADEDVTDLAYLTLSTGVGAGAIVDGHVLVGRRANAVELGHVTLDPDAPVACGCGGVGHWEALCGGANLPAHAAVLADEWKVETDLDLPGCTPAALLEAVGRDPLATRLAERVGRFNALGVATIVHAYDPARIHVGGAIARNHPETILAPIRERLPALCLFEPPPVSLATLGAEAVERGALASAVTGGTGRPGPER